MYNVYTFAFQRRRFSNCLFIEAISKVPGGVSTTKTLSAIELTLCRVKSILKIWVIILYTYIIHKNKFFIINFTINEYLNMSVFNSSRALEIICIIIIF